MKHYEELVTEALSRVKELMPWDLVHKLAADEKPLLLDVREPAEFAALHIDGAMNVPRGILEQSCEWDYDETIPELVTGRDREIVVICRSGKRSVLAADMMLKMGFTKVISLKTGMRGWSDYEQPMTNARGTELTADDGDVLLASQIKPEQRKPK
ncbi:MAG: rhodanese-like domain-containing protein [Rhodoferax sp.]|nr:rhodanese-like domain-containing protein [Rhodoferax sp.]MCF8208234.1 rhodanese-like domain-containing protein [Rhodoferax sp.]